jgi:hypothetical protein
MRLSHEIVGWRIQYKEEVSGCYGSNLGSVPARIDRNLFVKTSRPAVGLTLPPAQWVPGKQTQGEKQSGSEAVHSHPFRAQIKNWWGYTYTPAYAFNGCTGTSLSTRCHMPTQHRKSRLAKKKERCPCHLPLQYVCGTVEECLHSFLKWRSVFLPGQL